MPTPAEINAALAYADAHLEASLEPPRRAHPHQVDLDRSRLRRRMQARRRLAGRRPRSPKASTPPPAPTPGHPMVVAPRSARARDRTCCSTPITTCSRSIRSTCGTPIRSSCSCVTQPDGETHLVARGTSDDKGQLLTFLEACRAWRATAGAPAAQGLDDCLEGEEESGSKNLAAFLDAAKAELTADIALVCDTDMWDPKTPSITTMLRGLVGEEIEITCADQDLHSGMYGNAARNPNQVLAEIIAVSAQPRRLGRHRGLLRRCRRKSIPSRRASWDKLGFDERRLPQGSRPLDPRRRTVPLRARTDLVAARPARSTA